MIRGFAILDLVREYEKGFRAVTFDQVRDAYKDQVRGLIDACKGIDPSVG